MSESGVSLYQLEKDLLKYIAVTSLLTNPRRELKRMTSLRGGKNCVCYKMSVFVLLSTVTSLDTKCRQMASVVWYSEFYQLSEPALWLQQKIKLQRTQFFKNRTFIFYLLSLFLCGFHLRFVVVFVTFLNEICSEITPRNAALPHTVTYWDTALLKSKWQLKEGKCRAIKGFVTRVWNGQFTELVSF